MGLTANRKPRTMSKEKYLAWYGHRIVLPEVVVEAKAKTTSRPRTPMTGPMAFLRSKRINKE